MDKEFEASVAYYKKNFDELEKEIKTRENGIIMLENTLSEADEKNTDTENKTLIIKAIEEEREKYEFLSEIKRVIEVETSKDTPKVSQEDIELLEKIHNFEENTVVKEKNAPTKKDREAVLDNWYSINSLRNNGYNLTNSIRQPILDYCFIVELPELFDTKPNEINHIYYKLPEKCCLFSKRGTIDVSVRESVNTKQMENALKNRGKHIYGEIRLVKIDTQGRYLYTMVFTGLKFEGFEDNCYSYGTEEPHGLYLRFKYKEVKYVTDKTNETAAEKNNTKEAGKKKDNAAKDKQTAS